MTEAVVKLQAALRPELKEPMGPVYTDTDELLATAQVPIITVGDMVTYHLLEADRVPDVALVDEHTERTAVEDSIVDAFEGFDREVTVANPAATLTAELLTTLQTAIERASEETTLIVVDGEEDLATLPALVAAPTGASVVYGQPGEGMVHVEVTRTSTDRARDLLSQMDGEQRRLWSVLSSGE
ncbi:GTP-dependent dephospho-CoA kinase family protein [Salinibaculum rarum]|uniref:GTP-dependent dephospho-CoA kinase family protein n=1 Tax=Salinibaculum rarum TaxID=3058903 RepID=UPI0026600614|nr:GTP-dependent dephospho-CoA kinase family protein [Salinibaculum sp. KK48]